jgi:uroporphyrinogen-III synthase
MLQGRRIAVPESRELDLFAGMLERQGAVTVRCPLVSIHDVEDAAPVQAWLERLAGGQHDSLILYTGEGLARLLGFARRGGIEAEVIAGLRQTRKIVRGLSRPRSCAALGSART